MKHSGKTCKEEGCTFPLFARGWCKGHYNTLYLLPKQKEKPKKKYVIPRKTEDKAKDDRLYLKKRVEFIQAEMRKDPQGRVFCIFCGKEIKGPIDLHHALGRDDDLLLDQRYWFLSHNFCHVHQYHSMGWAKIPWWQEYIARILKTGIHEIIVLESKRMER